MPTDPAIERHAIALFQEAIDIPPADRAAWIEVRTQGDPELGKRLAAMLRADALVGLQTGGAIDGLDEDAPPERIGAYRIVERIGRGGMGAVYRGERMTGDFDHVAAIKLIKPGLLSERLVERFQRERQTLAGLEHPYIARLYDGGETADGAPFIVMEYVDGQPIADWADAQGLDRDGRLKLMSDVCDAVAYAHRNLVVHRDITPSNVLVTRDGTVKLIDFGIAKPADEGGDGNNIAPSSIASLSLTPGYAAPERMSGNEATTSSDIFSLGKLFEKLVASCPAHVEQAAIIARATAPSPADRYPTADAFRADIEAASSQFPVAAMGSGRRYLAAKFVRRHRFGTAAAGVALALLLGAFALTIIANIRAEAARAEAERRFAQTRSIAKALLFDVYDEVSRIPGSTDARMKLATTGLAYLDALAADKNAPRDLRIEVGRGYLRLAETTGSGLSGQVGKLQDTNALLARAKAILEPLHTAHPADPAVARAYAEYLVEQSQVDIYNNNNTGLARSHAMEAERLLDRLGAPDRETATLRALAIQAQGDAYLWVDDFGKALPHFQRAEAFAVGLPPALANDAELLAARSANLRLLGEALHKLKDEAATRIVLDRAVEINRRLVNRAPQDPATLRRFAVSLWYRAIVHRSNYRDSEARASIEEALAIARGLSARDASDAGALKLLAAVQEVYAQVLADLKRFPESYAMGDQVQAAQERLVRLAGNAPGALRSMATTLSTTGGNHYNGTDFAGACRVWRQSLGIFEALERRRELAETDRKNGMAELRHYLTSSCENGPPHAGMGSKM